MQWDDEAEIVCVGSGVGGLATAIAAVDVGFDVCVADAARLEVDDEQTDRYFRELSQDLLVGARVVLPKATPVRVVGDLAPAEPRARRVDPFIGSGLQDWAAGCLASPYGFLYSQVTDRMAVAMRSSRGERFAVTPIGAIESGCDLPRLDDWLCAQARRRGIDVVTDSPLLRLVFDDDCVVGAVVGTVSGPRAVRARRGVLVSTGGHDDVSVPIGDVPDNATLHVGVLRQAPSRFGRVELLAAPPPVGSLYTTCRAANRHLMDAARETRRSVSANGCCGELHRYPPLGQ
ncbi:FAD-binding protein [Mycolicibacterium moriokaense]|nr:FAD-binding protein [Mycolicibacterium moriokaense]